MSYALLDWDNTLREGYTLLSFSKYLVRIKLIDYSIIDKTNYFFEKYKAEIISHDEFAKYACETFSLALQSISAKDMNAVLDQYMLKDNKWMFRFTPEIFKTLHKNNIQPIIVSGAPVEVLNRYKKMYNISEIYAYATEIINDKYTGNVLYNYGYNKSKIVSEICSLKAEPPILAIGDSASDYKMLKAAQKCIVVGQSDKLLKLLQPNAHINRTDSPKEVASLISKILKLDTGKSITTLS